MKRRILAIVLTVIMALSLTTLVTAGSLAADLTPPASDIVVNAPDGASLDGTTINLYKIFNATWNEDQSSYSYTFNSALGDEAAFLSDVGSALDQTFATTNDLVTYLSEQTDNSSVMYAFASAAQTFIGDADATYTANGSGSSVTFTRPASNPGYYLITGYVTQTSDGTAIDKVTSALILDTNATSDGNPLQITLKLNVPTIEKQVTNLTANPDPDSSDYSGVTTANIGDTVQYILTSAVPNMAGYDAFTFTMNDTLSQGLTPPSDPSTGFTVQLGGTTLTYGDDYTVTYNPTAPAAGTPTSITIDFPDFIHYADQAGDPITVTYNATVNANAVVATGASDMTSTNPNTVTLTYSNDPSNGGSGTTTETPPSVANVYTFQLQVYKYTGDLDSDGGTPLANAQFVLLPASQTATAPGDAIKFSADTTNGGVIVDSQNGAAKLTSDANGNIAMNGLAPGTYYLVETAAPDGYNKLTTPITVVISLTVDNEAVPVLSYTQDDTALSSNSNTINVQNNAGRELPSTGGIGTTIFTVAGVAIMLGVAVVLIVRRKTRASEQ